MLLIKMYPLFISRERLDVLSEISVKPPSIGHCMNCCFIYLHNVALPYCKIFAADYVHFSKKTRKKQINWWVIHLHKCHSSYGLLLSKQHQRSITVFPFTMAAVLFKAPRVQAQHYLLQQRPKALLGILPTLCCTHTSALNPEFRHSA